MSRNARLDEPRIDRRVQRTRDRLGDALIELIQERSFESVTVQDVLDRAGVGRTTFYAHFRDKQDLFLSDADDFLRHMTSLLERDPGDGERLAPVRELFLHVGEMRPLHAALTASGKIQDFLDLAHEHFARSIARRLAAHPRAAALPSAPRAAQGHALAGALLSLLAWWLEHPDSASAADMDALFHRLAWSGVETRTSAALENGRRHDISLGRLG